MKLLKVFGIVAGIHVIALILIFANPGCSTNSHPAPSAADTNPAPMGTPPPAPSSTYTGSNVSVPLGPDSTAINAPVAGTSSPVQMAPLDDTSSGGLMEPGRFTPTRPGSPAATAMESSPVADVTPAQTYTVTRGDSLWSIAHRNHLTVAQLVAANNLKSTSVVQVGQKLIIPSHEGGAAPAAKSAAEHAVKSAAAKAPAGSLTHVVQPGETLGNIARKFHVSVGVIATANSIADPSKIRPGQKLVIPGGKEPAKTAAAATTPPLSQPAAATEAPPAEVNPASPPNSPLFVPPGDSGSSPAPDQGAPAPDNNAAPVIQVGTGPSPSGQ